LKNFIIVKNRESKNKAKFVKNENNRKRPGNKKENLFTVLLKIFCGLKFNQWELMLNQKNIL